MSQQSQRPQQRRAPPQGAPRAQRQGPPQPKERQEINFFDVRILVGMDAETVRFDRAGWDKFNLTWVLGGMDVLLRATFERSELQMVLRGAEGGKIRVSAADPAQKIPVYSVFTTIEARKMILDGIERRAAEPPKE